MSIVPSEPQLELLRQARIQDLVEDLREPDAEASGVLAKGGLFYVIFDNCLDIACIGESLSPGRNGLIPGKISSFHADGSDIAYEGYEDITHDQSTGRFYLLIEALERESGDIMAAVQEYDDNFRHISSHWLNFRLKHKNKGLEGLTSVQRAEGSFLLGLCEGNRCEGREQGPGGGRMQIFRKGQRHWDHQGTIPLPKTVSFEDYSALDVVNDRIVVISQDSSKLWVGPFSPSSWTFTDDGRIYTFPVDREGKSIYCNAEGVSWMTSDQVVVVSDKLKDSWKEKKKTRCRANDQSIHIFGLP